MAALGAIIEARPAEVPEDLVGAVETPESRAAADNKDSAGSAIALSAGGSCRDLRAVDLHAVEGAVDGLFHVVGV